MAGTRSPGQVWLWPLLLLADASGAAMLPSTSAALVAACVLGALGAVPVVPLLRWRPPAQTGQRSSPAVPIRELLRGHRMPSALLASLALLSAVDILTAYLPLIAESRGIPPEVVGVLLSLRAGCSLLSRLALPRLLNRWPRKTLIVASTAVSGLSLALVALPGAGPATLAVLLAVGGLLLGLGQPLTMAEVVMAAPRWPCVSGGTGSARPPFQRPRRARPVRSVRRERCCSQRPCCWRRRSRPAECSGAGNRRTPRVRDPAGRWSPPRRFPIVAREDAASPRNPAARSGRARAGDGGPAGARRTAAAARTHTSEGAVRYG